MQHRQIQPIKNSGVSLTGHSSSRSGSTSIQSEPLFRGVSVWLLVLLAICESCIHTSAEAAEARDTPRRVRVVIEENTVLITWTVQGASAGSSRASARVVVQRRDTSNTSSVDPWNERAALEPGTTRFIDDLSGVLCTIEEPCPATAQDRLRYRVCFRTSAADLAPVCSAETFAGARSTREIEILSLQRVTTVPELRYRLRVFEVLNGERGRAASPCLLLTVRLARGGPSRTESVCSDSFDHDTFHDWSTPFSFPIERATPFTHFQPARPPSLTFNACPAPIPNGRGTISSDDRAADLAACVSQTFSPLGARPPTAPRNMGW